MKTRVGDRAWLLVAAMAAAAAAGCAQGQSPAVSGGCQDDNDCKGARICVGGTCVDPGGAAADLSGVAARDLLGAPAPDLLGAPAPDLLGAPAPDLANAQPPEVDLSSPPIDMSVPPVMDLSVGPTCADQIRNGDESDVDCGGNACPHCVNGKHCNGNGDCASGFCDQAECKPMPTCNDGIQNEGESDIDCGGQFCGPCGLGKMCVVNGDCQTNICNNHICSAAPNCNDNIKNQDETDIDCGGQICAACADGKNCLANRDCQSGSCNANVCGPMPPVALAMGLNRPFDIALDANNVYWVENNNPGALRKVSKNGGGTSTLNQALENPTALVVDANNVYVLENNNGSNGRISMIPINGGNATQVVGGLLNAQNHLAQDGNNNLYYGDGVQGGGGAIKRVAKGANQNPTTLASGCAKPAGLCNVDPAVDTDGSSVFFRNDFGSILAVSVNGGNNPNTLGAGNAWSLRLSGSNLYFVDGQNGLVGSMTTAGANPMTLTNAAPNAGDLAVDGNYVYWIELNNPGSVNRVPVGGGQKKVYSNQGNTIGIEVDGTYVFWAVSDFLNQGMIMRSLK